MSQDVAPKKSQRAVCFESIGASTFDEAMTARADRQTDATCMLRFDLKLITPMMGGGVSKACVNELKPIRESEVKHHLRWWWRRLARYGLLPEVDGKRPDSLSRSALYEAERKRFGGVESKDKTTPSQVRVWIEITKEGGMWSPNQFPHARYAWFPLIRTQYEATLLLGVEFTVFVECEPDFRNEISEAARWWINFGGVGARNNRGMGSLQPTNVEQPYSLVGEDEAAQCGMQLKVDVTKGVTSNDAVRCWSQAIDWMRRYRQGHDPNDPRLKFNTSGSPLTAGIGDAVRPAGVLTSQYRPGRSRWPDANSVRKIFGIPGSVAYQHIANSYAPSFPKATLGMPVAGAAIKGSHDGEFSYGSFEISPVNGDRLSSPVRVKARATSAGGYEPIAITFLDHRDFAMQLQAKVSFTVSKNVKFKPLAGSGNYPAWIPMQPFPPPVELLGGSLATDPIDGFMRFFGDATKASDFK